MQPIDPDNSKFLRVRKLYKKLPVFIFLILHFLFLIAAIFENQDNFYPALFLLGLAILLVFFYSKKLKKDVSRLKKIDILLVIFTILGALSTYWLNSEYNLGAVLASGIVGLLSSFIPFINRRSDLLREVPVPMYCGSFVGMTAPFIANGYTFIFFSGLICGIILIISKGIFQGYGGKLGTVAFGGVSVASLILFLFF